ncbi:MAG: hypothetical protein KC449_07220 [Anaerolineales bacterium]|nr:hypothetical protein [Anaerolineales bacterium]
MNKRWFGNGRFPQQRRGEQTPLLALVRTLFPEKHQAAKTNRQDAPPTMRF